MGATLVLYPKPFGIQTQYNFGKGPRYDKLTNTVDVTDLEGGYVTLNYKWDINLAKHHFLYPFAKFQYYDGGKKFEKDARSYVVRDYELGNRMATHQGVRVGGRMGYLRQNLRRQRASKQQATRKFVAIASTVQFLNFLGINQKEAIP